jgi:hypothetical protein
MNIIEIVAKIKKEKKKPIANKTPHFPVSTPRMKWINRYLAS